MKTVDRNIKTPKARFTADQVVDAAFKILRDRGQDAVVARAVANELGCSTMPIYSYIKSKRRLIDELLNRAFEVLDSYLVQKRTGDMWIDWGVGYIIFSLEEPELFKLILREQSPMDESKPHFKHWSNLIEAAEDYVRFEGLSDEQVEMVMLRRAIFSIGLATYLSKAPKELLSEAQIIDMVKGTSLALLEGARSGTMTVV